MVGFSNNESFVISDNKYDFFKTDPVWLSDRVNSWDPLDLKRLKILFIIWFYRIKSQWLGLNQIKLNKKNG